jgi:hypothetical protein
VGPSTERNGGAPFSELIHLHNSNYQAQFSTSPTVLFKALETMVKNIRRRLAAVFDHRSIAVVYEFNPTAEKIDLENMC